MNHNNSLAVNGGESNVNLIKELEEKGESGRSKTGMLKGSVLAKDPTTPRNADKNSKQPNTKELRSMKQAAMLPAEAICLNDQILDSSAKAGPATSAIILRIEKAHAAAAAISTNNL